MQKKSANLYASMFLGQKVEKIDQSLNPAQSSPSSKLLNWMEF